MCHIITINNSLINPVCFREYSQMSDNIPQITSLNTTVVSSTVVHLKLSEILQDSPNISKRIAHRSPLSFPLEVLLGLPRLSWYLLYILHCILRVCVKGLYYTPIYDPIVDKIIYVSYNYY
jgi:hypothetical protein